MLHTYRLVFDLLNRLKSDGHARLGKEAEMTVLARGLLTHLEDRVLVHGDSTVVFT